MLWKRWHINAVVPERQRKTSKPIGWVVSKRVRCLSWFNVFTCWILSHYYLDAKLVLFLDWASQQHILFTVTEVLDEELIRICTRLTKTSIGTLRHLYSLSHLLVGFMLLWVFSFHPMWNVRCMIGFTNAPESTEQDCCETEKLHFATFCTLHSGTAQTDII